MKAGPPEIIFGGYVHIFNFTLKKNFCDYNQSSEGNLTFK